MIIFAQRDYRLRRLEESGQEAQEPSLVERPCVPRPRLPKALDGLVALLERGKCLRKSVVLCGSRDVGWSPGDQE